MTDKPPSEARERVLRVAEALFSERGYAAVTLRDIAGALGMKQASLYNHAPGGKEELFVAVTERNLARHRAGIARALAEAGPDLRRQLGAVAAWLLAQPPTNLQRMEHSDMPAIAPDEAERLRYLAYQALLAPVMRAIAAAVERGEVDPRHEMMLGGTFVSAVEAVRGLEQYTSLPEQVMAERVIDLLLEGARPR